MQDPPRLKELAETPDELSAALDALRQTPNDAARVARVAGRLGPWLDTPAPPQVGSMLPHRVAPHALKALRLFVAGMVVGASVLWLSRPSRPAERPLANPAASSPSVVDEVPAVIATPLVTAESVEISPQPDGTTARAPRRSSHAAEARAWHGTRVQGRSEPALRAGAGNASADVAGAGASDTSASSASASSAAAEHGTSVQDSAASAGPEQPGAAAPASPPAEEKPAEQPRKEADVPKGEVELLFQARQLRRSAPRKALALLDEHAARFTDGMLAPEREVIAIELLRALGQTEQAAQRLARYRARYPQSLHLPGLENKH